MPAVWLHNLAAHWLQACLLAGAAAAVAAALRLRHPGLRLIFWRSVLALALALPLLQRWQPAPPPTASPASAIPVAFALVRAGSETDTASSWPQMVLVVIVAGVVARIGWLGLGLVRLRRMRKLPAIDAESVDEFEAAMRELGVRSALRRSEFDGPLSFGAWNPIIVLPSTFSTLDRDARRSVALHELVHVRRRDWMKAFVEEILLTLVWFHPWSWWVRAQIRLAREEIVDREVVARLGSREAYASCLLSVAGYDLGRLQPGVALLRRRELHYRLDALFQEVVMSRLRLVATVGLLVTVLTGAAVGAASAFPFMAVSGGAQAGTRRVVQLVPPDYPEAALDQEITGTVAIELTVNTAGEVSGWNVTDGPTVLHDATIAAVRQWKFERRRTADVVLVEVGYRLTIDNRRRIPGWSFSVRSRSDATAAPPAVDEPLRVGGDVSRPKFIKEVKAVYSPEAMQARVQGSVHLEATIGADGKARNIKVVRSIPLLDKAAIDAMQQSVFEPGTRNGVAVPVVIQCEFRFALK
jgi:TonB family protein